jgi:hypothetical protein
MSNDLSVLFGKTIKDIDVSNDCGNDTIQFNCEDGRSFLFTHNQACCERVNIESIVGDINDLIGSPLTLAEEVQGEIEDSDGSDYYIDARLWTFYKFATIKDYVDIRWLGESNGYYSMEVDFEEVKPAIIEA